jgi:hypothetical protein
MSSRYNEVAQSEEVAIPVFAEATHENDRLPTTLRVQQKQKLYGFAVMAVVLLIILSIRVVPPANVGLVSTATSRIPPTAKPSF